MSQHIYWLKNIQAVSATTIFHWLNNLSKSDRDRINKMRSSKRRKQFITGRALVNHAMQHVGLDYQPVTTDKKGIPSIISGDCSISHTGQCVVVSVTTENAIGIDIETITQRDFLILAQYYFHHTEQQVIETLPQDQRALEFYKIWTIKEALAKSKKQSVLPLLNKNASTIIAHDNLHLWHTYTNDHYLSLISLDPTPPKIYSVTTNKNSFLIESLHTEVNYPPLKSHLRCPESPAVALLLFD
jgi:phosphopantetheinyl transferase